MAYALRKISNGGYIPDANGRDWFFIGSFDYKNGRKTPDMNVRRMPMTDPPKRPRGQPTEMTYTKAVNGGASSSSCGPKMSPRIAERLRRQQSEPTCNDAIQARSASYTHCLRWRDSNSTRRDLKVATRLRSSNPKDTSHYPEGHMKATSSDLGQLHKLGQSWSFSEYGAPDKFLYHSAVKARMPPKQDEVDDHMKEFPGKQKNPPAIQHKLWQSALEECERPIDKPLNTTFPANLEFGHPAKHHHNSNRKIYPPSLMNLERSDLLPKREAGWRPPEW